MTTLAEARQAHEAARLELRAAGRAYDADLRADIEAGRLPPSAAAPGRPYDDGRRGREDVARAALTAATKTLNEAEEQEATR